MTTLTANKNTNYVVGAWLVLMVLTAATWWVGADHAIAGFGRDAAMVSILVLTFAKIYVVGHAFMEMREAAPWLTRTFTAWCIALCAVLSAMYLLRV
ncbi:cytochrome C oxidase subunit IV family protein [Nocardia sp. NPDC059246]|uniref:cytochrome C oxidase subunit IV family protein n=1 Tax=unclassified Nocardia TaxID=2637762 RepID=UPI00368CCAD0